MHVKPNGLDASHQLVVTLLEVSEKEEGVVALHLPIGLWVVAGTEI